MVVRKYKMTRMFNGREYKLVRATDTKRKANNKIKSLKARGELARKTPTTGGWLVWSRKR